MFFTWYLHTRYCLLTQRALFQQEMSESVTHHWKPKIISTSKQLAARALNHDFVLFCGHFGTALLRDPLFSRMAQLLGVSHQTMSDVLHLRIDELLGTTEYVIQFVINLMY